MSQGLGIFLASLVTSFGAAIGLLIKYYFENKELKKEIEEIIHDTKTEVSLDLPSLNELDEIITDVMKKTSVDRFVIFKGENGGNKPLIFTSAILERHAKNMYMMLSVGATCKYVRVHFDSNYLDMLKSIEATKKGMFLDVEQMPASDLKQFYEYEQVKHSSVWFQKRHVIDDNKHIILYYSFATHTSFPFTEKEKMILQLAANKIAGLNFKVTKSN